MLSKQQVRLAADVYGGRLSEKALSSRHKVSLRVLREWLRMPEFQAELQRLCDESMQETRCTISRYGPVAALKLAELLASGKEDTVRRAALDLVDRCLKNSAEPVGGEDEEEQLMLSDDDARRMLFTLAEGTKNAG